MKAQIRLAYKTWGKGPPVLLIHGMASSKAYWEVLKKLDGSHQYIAVDLLGFGRSPKPDCDYDYSDHLGAIEDTLKELEVTGPMIVVGHSMGSLLALRLAAEQPDKVSKLVLCGLPYYPDLTTARGDITNNKWYLRLAYYGPTSQWLCTSWCRVLRPFTRHLAPYYLKRLPKEIASDSVYHTWHSYSRSLKHVIEEQNVPADIKRVKVPIHLLYGEAERSLPYIEESGLTKQKNVKLQSFEGLTHQMPIEKPEAVLAAIKG